MSVGTSTDQSPRTDQFIRLLTQNERRVYGFILALIPNWADADEIAQETNVRLWQEFDKYEPGSDFGAWACTIAKYQILTFRKKRSRDQLQFSNEFIERVAQESRDSADDSDDRHRALSKCLERLDDTERDLLRACYQPGAKIKDAAGQLGRSVAATYKTLYRLRKALHGCIERRLHAPTTEL